MSKFACTASTSSLSSSASMRRMSFAASSSSTGTRAFGSQASSADWISMPASVERRAHVGELRRLGQDLEDAVLLGDVLGAGLDRGHEVVLGVPLAVDDDQAALVEEVGDGAGLAEAAAVLAEQVADVGAGAVAVLGHRLDEQRDAAGRVGLVHDVLDRGGVGARAGPLRDRALDVVLGHRRVLGLLDGELQRRVALELAPAVARGGRDRPRELREELAAPRVDDRLLVLDRRPLGVAGHLARLAGA